MKKSLLVIDDSPFISRQINEMVSGHEYEVIGHARSGEEGIKMYQELRPDAVTLDIIMPGIDGIETAEILLKTDPNIKIVMLSSLCDSETYQEIKDMGLKLLVPKPLEEELLLSSLERLFKNEKKKDSI